MARRFYLALKLQGFEYANLIKDRRYIYIYIEERREDHRLISLHHGQRCLDISFGGYTATTRESSQLTSMLVTFGGVCNRIYRYCFTKNSPILIDLKLIYGVH